MRNLINKDNEDFGLYILAVALTFFGAFFSIYMSSSFCSSFGADTQSKTVFMTFGAFIDIVKVCSGMALVSMIARKKKSLRTNTMVVFLIFSTVSFVSSSATIAENLNSRKSTFSGSSEKIQSLDKLIKSKEVSLDNFILMQKSYLENNYRTKAESLNDKILGEQANLAELIKSKEEIQDSDLSFLPILDVFNSLLPIGHANWQLIITIVFGSLLEIAGMFLLYLSFSLKNHQQITNEVGGGEVEDKASKVRVKQSRVHKVQISRKIEIPVSPQVYNEIIAKICSGNIVPTQRAFKKEIRLGNEKISQIFKKLVSDGVLNKEGRSYVLVNSNPSRGLSASLN
jgi:hypothetical protein